MQINHIEGATRTIGKSQGYKALPLRDDVTRLIDPESMLVTIREVADFPSMLTSWSPTPDELARLNAGAPVVLTILGTLHPPVMLSVGDAP